MFIRYIVITLFLFTSLSYARQNYSEQGIVTYKKLCKKCHGNPYKGASMLKKKEWKKVFANEDKLFLKVHLKNDKAMSVLKKNYYKNRRHHLVKFLMSSASDSGVVPACDGNFCGN